MKFVVQYILDQNPNLDFFLFIVLVISLHWNAIAI